MGVEEEYLLLDARSGLPSPRAAEVQAAADLEPVLNAGEVDSELLQAQVEIATPICTELAEVAAELSRFRGAVGGEVSP
nr:glutamate-cysteine ligase family protein [Streptomyces sp. NBC_00899]